MTLATVFVLSIFVNGQWFPFQQVYTDRPSCEAAGDVYVNRSPSTGSGWNATDRGCVASVVITNPP